MDLYHDRQVAAIESVARAAAVQYARRNGSSETPTEKEVAEFASLIAADITAGSELQHETDCKIAATLSTKYAATSEEPTE
jgi:hypothetical protein